MNCGTKRMKKGGMTMKPKKYAEGGPITEDEILRGARQTSERMSRAYDNATTRRTRSKAQLAGMEAGERDWRRSAELGSPMARDYVGTKEFANRVAETAALRRRLDSDRNDPDAKGNKYKRGGMVKGKK